MYDDSGLAEGDRPHWAAALTGAGDMGFMLYRSVARPGLGRADLEAILNQARRRNGERGLTGCLHHENGLFFQWLEGPRFTLSRLMERLRDDDRHVGVTVIDQGRLDRRLFGDWQMRHSDPATASLLEWLAGGGRSEADGVRSFLETIR